MQSVGEALRRWREFRGLSLRTLGEGIHHSHVYVWEIEKGRKPPLPEIIAACDDLLGAGGELVRLLRQDEVAVDRREFVRSGLTLAATPLFGPLAGLNDQLWKVFAAATNKSAVLPLVQAQLTLADSPRLRADLLQLAGEIYFDANRYADAFTCYAQAAVAADEARDRDLGACALVRHAFVHVFERRFAVALELLERSERLAAGGDPQSTTSQWVQAVKAQALAGVGQLADCERSLELASAVSGKTHNGGWLRFDGSRVAEESGACYVELGHAVLAEAALFKALAQPLSPRRHGMVLTDLASVGVLRRDREYVSHYAQHALEIGRLTGSGVVMSKLAHLQAHILEEL